MKEFAVLLVIIACWAIQSSPSMADLVQKEPITSPADSEIEATDVIPGRYCNGETQICKLTDLCAIPLFKEVHKKTEPTKNSNKGKFYGYYKISYEDVQGKAVMKGNCCWKYYSKVGFEGQELLLDLANRQKDLKFPAKSVRIVNCTTTQL